MNIETGSKTNEGDEIGVLTKYVAAEGKKKAVILFENDAAGISGRDDYADAFPKAGGAVVFGFAGAEVAGRAIAVTAADNIV